MALPFVESSHSLGVPPELSRMSQTPDFIIIGAMKCGTSTLHDQLACQPGFFLSTPKEPNYFSDDEIFARGSTWYQSLFASPEATGASLCGESSTHYTKLPTYPCTIDRIADALEHPRFIYVMRHPVERLVSHYIHEWSERTIEVPIDRAAEQVSRLVEYGCYAMQLAPFVERFGLDRVLPVFMERLLVEPQTELERIGRFLESPEPLTWQHDLGAKNVSRERMRASSWRDRLVNQPLLARLRRQLVPKSLRDQIRNWWTLDERPELSAGVRARLEATFDSDLAQLGGWLGVPLDCATYRERVTKQRLEWAEPQL